MPETELFHLQVSGFSLKMLHRQPSERGGYPDLRPLLILAETPQFSGSVRTEVPDEVNTWCGFDLRELYRRLDRAQQSRMPAESFHLESVEGEVELDFEFDNLGHMCVRVRLRDELHNARLEYTIHADQSYLPGLAEALAAGLSEHQITCP